MIPATISCRDFVEFLDDYLAGAVSGPRLEEFSVHLSMCPSCVAYMKTYRDASRMGKAALQQTDDPVPAEIPEALVHAILAARRKP